jgi:HK97 family phage prohead protease
METYDFSGWATRNDLKCADGRTIRRDAFKHNDGDVVPLVWNHQHDDPFNCLGQATLENKPEGVYAYCSFNNSESGKQARELVMHGDVKALSIYANHLSQNKRTGDVFHGDIKEVSLVLAGANPGALIEDIIQHSDDDDGDEQAIIYAGGAFDLEIRHSDIPKEEPMNPDEKLIHADPEPAEENDTEETIGDILSTLNEKQMNAVYAIVGQALEDGGATDDEYDEEGDTEVKHNIFDNDTADQSNILQHADMEAILADGKRYGSLRESALAHGIDGIDTLFPEPKNLNTPPDWITRKMDWVSKVMSGVHHTPFSRIKSMYADLTADEARAKGYIKGKLKKEQVFTLLKRTTTPTTIYKKQKLDRDDVIDITDFDVVAWLKTEMRFMLDEEIARAILVGDGRDGSSDDKINEMNIRPIWTDSDLYTIKATVTKKAGATEDDMAKAFIRTAIKSRKDYRGSGEPVLFTTEDMITNCLLLEDTTGRVIYDSIDKLRTVLRVREIIAVPVMEGLTRTDADDSKVHSLMGIIVNLNDYNVGADKGGAVNMFDDFDIDYNAQKYLIETRCSGAMIKPYAAIAIESVPEA